MIPQRPILVNRISTFKQVREEIKKKRQSAVEQEQLQNNVVSFFKECIDFDTKWEDDDILGKMSYLINNTPNYSLSNFQQQMIDCIFEIAAPVIYRTKSNERLLAILQKYGLMPCYQQIMMAKTSRRGGKTDTLTMCAALFLLFIPEIKILYFSLYEDTCRVACSTVYSWIQKWGLTEKVHKSALHIRYVNKNGLESLIMFITSQTTNVSFFSFIHSEPSFIFISFFNSFIFLLTLSALAFSAIIFSLSSIKNCPPSNLSIIEAKYF